MIADSSNPYYNLAMEQMLFSEVKSGEGIIFLWQNDNTVVIGQNQNPWSECNCRFLEEDGGHLARRLSGGGCVFHDKGNLNFTFICYSENYDVTRQLKVIQGACALAGIETQISGRNDIIADSRKFSGNAFYNSQGKSYHHGTILIDTDFDKIKRYLTPSEKKLSAKGVKSVQSRVVNLTEFCPDLTCEMMKEYMISSFEDIYGMKTEPTSVDKKEIALLRELYEYERMFAEKLLGDFQNGQDRVFKMQYIQYEWVRISFELARRNLWFNSGILYWMLSDCWPAASGWALIDYYGLPKASYYSFRRCAKAVVGSIDREDGHYTAYITNDSLSAQNLQMTVCKLNYQSGAVTPLLEKTVQADAQSVVRIPVACTLAANEILICDLQNDALQDRCFYKEGGLEMVKTDEVRIVEKTEASVTVEAEGYVHAVALEGNGVFGESYFSLLPSQRRTVSFAPAKGAEPEITCLGYTLA